MSDLSFRPAVRENVGLFIGLASESGGGKTWTAMELATGIVGPGGRFAVIDTENKRARHYADHFDFDVLDLTPPYSSARYEESVLLAVSKGYKAIVCDSFSHEHDGDGGYLDTQQDDLAVRVERYMKKYPNSKEYEVIEKLTPSSWIAPKRARKRMIQTLLACSTSIPIIFCFRAEEKVFGSKDGKMVAHNPPLWAPICGKGMPFEMTAFFLMHQNAPGVPIPLKLQEQHRSLFPLDRPLTRESGRRIAEWSAGAAKAAEGAPQGDRSKAASAPAGNPAPLDGAPPTADEALLVKAREWAECGTQDYAAWWKALEPEQRVAIGKERHESFKMIAAAVAA